MQNNESVSVTAIVPCRNEIRHIRAFLDSVMRQELTGIDLEIVVADGMSGQDAVKVASGFHEALGVTGVILTKMDGDARGGAALSIYGVTHAPIKFVGTGEGLDGLEPFHPDRMAGRILQQGDVLSLVERAQQNVDEEESKQLARKATSRRGMDLEDFLTAMRQMQKLGPLKNVLGMLPGVNA